MQGATPAGSTFSTTLAGFTLYRGTKDITLIPQPGGDVSLRVFPYSSTCDQTYYSSGYRLVGAGSPITIQRNPTASVTTAPFTINCGDQRPRTFTASQTQGAPTFNWSLPTSWTFSGPANGATITAIPNSGNGGNVSVTATYSCRGAAYTTAGATVAISFSQSVAPVFITPSPATSILYCSSATLTAEAVGATSYQWSASNGATVMPAITTTA